MQAVRQWSKNDSSLDMNFTKDALFAERTSATSSPSMLHPFSFTMRSIFLWGPIQLLNFCLKFGLKNDSSFDLRFSTLRGYSKMGSYLNLFFKPKLEPKKCLLNRAPGLPVASTPASATLSWRFGRMRPPWPPNLASSFSFSGAFSDLFRCFHFITLFGLF